jgi:hypothetical protein
MSGQQTLSARCRRRSTIAMLYACEIQMLDMKISIALSEREATP